jgi:hypothetical protein
MQGRRPEGTPDDVQPVGDIGQPEEQSTRNRRPLIAVEHGPAVAAAITAAVSLLIYSFNQIREIDHRLDDLEQEARILLDGQGAIRPSKEAMMTYYHLEALRDRVKRLEAK